MTCLYYERNEIHDSKTATSTFDFALLNRVGPSIYRKKALPSPRIVSLRKRSAQEMNVHLLDDCNQAWSPTSDEERNPSLVRNALPEEHDNRLLDGRADRIVSKRRNRILCAIHRRKENVETFNRSMSHAVKASQGRFIPHFSGTIFDVVNKLRSNAKFLP